MSGRDQASATDGQFCSVGVKIALISVVLGVAAINTFAIIRYRVVGSGQSRGGWLLGGSRIAIERWC